MRNREHLLEDIILALKSDPRLKASAIQVTVKNDIVFLTGHADSAAERALVRQIIRKMKGIRGVADAIEVSAEDSDLELTAAIAHVLQWNNIIADGSIRVAVSNGFVTLAGRLQWPYQYNFVIDALRSMPGLKGITDLITLGDAADVPQAEGRVVPLEIPGMENTVSSLLA